MKFVTDKNGKTTCVYEDKQEKPKAKKTPKKKAEPKEELEKL